jgi:hypothetical protein
MSSERTQKIEALRDLHKPTNFDAWVCLGGDYRDQAEVQEWASSSEAQELSLAYTAFRKKISETPEPKDPWEFFLQQQELENAKIKEEEGSQTEEALHDNECYWCEDTEGVTLVKSYQLYGCRECASECGSDK